MSTTDQTEDSTDELSPPPATAGWERFSDDDSTICTYWRKGSTHVSGAYTCLTLSESRAGNLSLHVTNYDEFGNRKSGHQITQRRRKHKNWIWDLATDHMKEYPAAEGFDERPALPTKVGPWTATSTEYRLTRWEHNSEPIALELTQSGRRSGHSFSTRYFDIVYQSTDGEPWTVATDIPSTSAYQIATHILETIEAPVTTLSDTTEHLRELDGIGSVRGRILVALGVTTKKAVRAATRAEAGDCPHPVNRHHSRAVAKRTTEATLSTD